MGQRIAKHVYDATGGWEKSTYYVRDPQGNVMTVYDQEVVASTMSYQLKERDIYGSSRVGMYTDTVEMIGASFDTTYMAHVMGMKTFELSNHLGNVLSTISDKVIPKDWNSDAVIDNYHADILSATDYYAFGVTMNGRDFSSSDYRYGFNGKLKDDEMHGNSGDSYDFGARIYDARLGRWLSTDYYETKYPGISPYVFSLNRPIYFFDKDGKDVGNGPTVVNKSSKPIVVTGDGNSTTSSGAETIFRGAVTLNPGDSFKPITTTQTDGTVVKSGVITRADGTTESTAVHDIDFIDVQPKQLMVFDDGFFSTEDIYVDNQPDAEYNKDEYVPEVDTPANRDNTEYTKVHSIKTPAKGEIKISNGSGTVTLSDEALNGNGSKVIRIVSTGGDLEAK